MENTLRQLSALYPDAFPDTAAPSAPLLDADPDVRAEAATLAEAKFYLDLRAPSRPDASVVDAIMDAAAFASATPSGKGARALRADRPAVARQKRSRRMRRAGVLLAFSFSAMLGLGVVFRAAPPGAVSPPAPLAQTAPAPASTQAPSPSAVRETVAPVQIEAIAEAPAAAPTDWDDASSALRHVSGDLAQLEALTADLDADLSDLDALFDTPAQRLEAPPGTRSAAQPHDGKASLLAALARHNQ